MEMDKLKHNGTEPDDIDEQECCSDNSCCADDCCSDADNESCDCNSDNCIKENVAKKCKEIKDACCSAAKRISRDWKETDGNPCFRKTKSCTFEVLRSTDDTTPVDTFHIEKTCACSLRALAIAGAAVALIAGIIRMMKK